MSETNEIWKCIDDEYEPYEISNLGRVRNRENGKILKAYINTNGYLTVRINGKKSQSSSSINDCVSRV